MSILRLLALLSITDILSIVVGGRYAVSFFSTPSFVFVPELQLLPKDTMVPLET